MVRFTLQILLFGLLALPAQAAFTSLYAFGDSVSTTTTSPGGQYYYGNRYSNGRVWLEVLAQRQGVTYDAKKNRSYWGHDSYNLVTNVNQFGPPADANTALFVVWVSDADFVFAEQNYTIGDLTTWNGMINRCLTNHYKALTNLYHAKGARTLILPNACDISKAPYYSGMSAADKSFIRQRVQAFNSSFAALLNQLRASLPNVTIYSPDFFAFMDDILAHPGNYGVINPGIDALENQSLAPWLLNGPGANYVFWDNMDPTAKVHLIMADLAQQMISPVRITQVTPVNGSNRLDVINIPIERNGFVSGSTDFTNWTKVRDITSTNATQSVFVPMAGPQQFYRLVFPAAVWTWP